MKTEEPAKRIYGLMASFDGPDDIVAAANKAREEGYKRIDAYTPYPVEGLADAVGFPHTWLPLFVLAAAIAGGVGGFLMQYWMVVVDYPLNIGGRPLFSWPAWIPATYELTILFGALGATVGMILFNGLPMPYHPVFNVAQFRRASIDSFFLVIESRDKKFDDAGTRQFLESLNPQGVFEVEP